MYTLQAFPGMTNNYIWSTTITHNEAPTITQLGQLHVRITSCPEMLAVNSASLHIVSYVSAQTGKLLGYEQKAH